MTQSKRLSESPEKHEPHAEPRDRVRERMRRMARLALLAATPLTNGACDAVSPSPPSFAGTGGSGGAGASPTCEKTPSTWAQFLNVEAAWGTEAGERIVLLTVTNPTDRPWLQAPSSYEVKGGTLLPSTAGAPNVLRIKPDADATTIRLKGTMTCHVLAKPMVITIDHLSDNKPTVAIDIG